MKFGVLGPVEVLSGGTPLALGGMVQRAALGYLLLHSNKVVATSALVRAVWGHDAPPTARKMVQNAVSRLRRTLAEGDLDAGAVELTTCSPGYLLRIDPDTVDVHRFRTLAERGRAELSQGRQDRAAATLAEALAQWRGPALADLTEVGIEWPQTTLLENERLAAFEDSAEASLALGRHFEVVRELEAMTEAEPTRERLCGQLMVALYRCHRQREALAVYQRTRMALVETFGLDPGRELQSLEMKILQHDESLATPGRLPAPAPTPQRSPQAAPVSRQFTAAMGAVTPHTRPARDRSEELVMAHRWRGADPLWASLW